MKTYKVGDRVLISRVVRRVYDGVDGQRVVINPLVMAVGEVDGVDIASDMVWATTTELVVLREQFAKVTHELNAAKRVVNELRRFASNMDDGWAPKLEKALVAYNSKEKK